MTEKGKSAASKKPKVEKLELNKETVQDLTESQAEDAAGGQVFRPRSPKPCLDHENVHQGGVSARCGFLA